MAFFTSKIRTHEAKSQTVLFETVTKPKFERAFDVATQSYKLVESQREHKVVVAITLPCGATAFVDPEELLRAAKALNQ